MSKTYNPSAMQHTAYTLPEDNDLQDAASVNVPLEALADDVRWCFDHVIGGDMRTIVHSFRGATTGSIGSSATNFEDVPSTGSEDAIGLGFEVALDTQFTIQASFQASGSTYGGQYQLAYSLDGATMQAIVGAAATVNPFQPGEVRPVTLCGSFVTLDDADDIRFYLQVRSLTGGSTASAHAPWNFTATGFKANE
jgi:hypothetical protein